MPRKAFDRLTALGRAAAEPLQRAPVTPPSLVVESRPPSLCAFQLHGGVDDGQVGQALRNVPEEGA